MQDPDVDQTGYGRGITRREIPILGAVRITLTVEHEPTFRINERLGGFGPKLEDVVGQRELLRHLALRIVIALRDDHSYVGLTEALHLTDEKQTRRVVTPLTVEQIASQNQGLYGLLDAQVDE